MCSDNATLQQEYLSHGMSECHMEIYLVCQGGHQLVKKIELEFDEGQQITSLPLSMCLTVKRRRKRRREREAVVDLPSAMPTVYTLTASSELLV